MEGRTNEHRAAIADRDGIVEAANDTRRPWGSDECLDVLFAAQAERWPASPAVLSGGEATSYGRLLSWADGIAARLRAAGAEPGDLVGVCGTPSPAVIAGVLGILRAGCAYVPLEADWLPERLRFMAEDCGLRLVVCDAEHESLVNGIGHPGWRRGARGRCGIRAAGRAVPPRARVRALHERQHGGPEGRRDPPTGR